MRDARRIDLPALLRALLAAMLVSALMTGRANASDESHLIRFYPSANDGAPAYQRTVGDNTAMLADDIPEMEPLADYDNQTIPFAGWGTASDPAFLLEPSGALFDFGTPITRSHDLYAVYPLDMTFTATSGGSVSTAAEGGYSHCVRCTNYLGSSVKTVIYAKPDSGWYFIGCRFGSAGQYDGADARFVREEKTDSSGDTVYQISVPTNHAYQVHVQFGHKVTFDSRGGSEVAPLYIVDGGRVPDPYDAPTRDGGWAFLHWCGDAGLREEYDFSTQITNDTTLYAKWGKGARIGVYNQSNPTQRPYSCSCGTVDIATSQQDYSLSEVSWPMNYYAPEGPVTYTATPAEGYRFVGWFEGVVGESHFVEQPTGDARSTELTCTIRGEDAGSLCAVFACARHQWDQTIQKATLTDDGSITATCRVCGCSDGTVPLPAVRWISLSQTSFPYTGSEIRPAVSVAGDGGALSADCYDISYCDNIAAGTAAALVTLKGPCYEGSKTLEFQITPTDQTLTASAPSSLVPGQTARITAAGQGTITCESSAPQVATVDSAGIITALSPGSTTITVRASGDRNWNSAQTQLTLAVNYLPTPEVAKVENVTDGVRVTLKKVSGAAAYRVFCKTGKGSWKKAGDTATTTFLWKGGKSGTKYAFTVRCIPRMGSGIYSSDCNRTGRSITYVAAPRLTALKNSQASTATATWKRVSGINGYELQYSASKSFKGAKSAVIKKPAAVSKAVGSLKKGRTYYFRIRSFKTVSGKRVLSGWSAVKTIRIKK